MADSSGAATVSTSPVLAGPSPARSDTCKGPAAGPASAEPVVPAPDVPTQAATTVPTVPALPATVRAVPAVSAAPVVPVPAPAPAKPAPPKSFRDAILGVGGEVSARCSPIQGKDYSSPEMQAKHLPLIQGNHILTSPEIATSIVPRTLDFITRDLQSRRIVSLTDATFEAAMKAMGIPIRLFAKTGFGKWNILLPSEEEAKKYASKVYKYTAADRRSYLFHPEYLGCRKTKIVVMGAPANVADDTLCVLFEKYGRVESFTRDDGPLGTPSGRCIFQVYLPLEKIAEVPSKVTTEFGELVVMVEGRQPTCWRCGRTGHLAKLCPLGRPTTEAAQKAQNAERSAAVTDKNASSSIPGLSDPAGWQVKGAKRNNKKVTKPSHPEVSAPTPVATKNRRVDLPEETPMDMSKSRKRTREEAGNAAVSQTVKKTPSTPSVKPSPCGTNVPAPSKGPPSPTKPKRKLKKATVLQPDLETYVSSTPVAPAITPSPIPEDSPDNPPEIPVSTTPLTYHPTPNPDPIPTPDPPSIPPSKPVPVPAVVPDIPPVPPLVPVTPPDPSPVADTVSSGPNTELFSFSDYLESEDDSGSSSTQEPGDSDHQVPRHKKPFPFQTGRNICKVDRRLKYEWTAISREALKPLLDFTSIGKGDSAKNVENPLLFRDAPSLITTVRVSKESGGRKPEVWTMLDAAQDAFSDLKLFEEEDPSLESLAARCRDRVPIYVHPSFYRALKLTYPYDVGGLVRDGRFTKIHARGIMARLVGVLSAADFQGF